MVAATVDVAAGRVPVVAGVLAPGFADAVQAGRELKAAGADGLLLITPYYTPPTQAGIRTYFEAYRGAVDLPLLLYEIPARTGIAVTAETIAAMAEDGSIIGMKSCNPDLGQLIRVLALAADRIAVLSGEEPYFATQVGMGAAGGILATANLVPRLWREIYALASRGDLQAALEKQDELLPFLAAVFAETNPGPLKAAMAMADLAVGEPLLPLGPPSRDTLQRLQAVVPSTLRRERAAAQTGPSAAR
jgi:4-hydroxy-tetrahydrodipicolinate synthase